MKKSFVYTRTGDKGTTSLIGGTRVPKYDIRLEAYGTIDELNAHIGLLISAMENSSDIKFLRVIQNKLFDVGSHLATDQSKTTLHRTSVMSEDEVEELEQRIDEMDENQKEKYEWLTDADFEFDIFINSLNELLKK